MSEENTKDLTDSEKLDAILARIEAMDARLTRLEENQGRQTRPLLDQINQRIEGIEEKLRELTNEVRDSNRVIQQVALEQYKHRSRFDDLEARVLSLERKPS